MRSLQTKRALDRVMMLEYGFGPETMRLRKICPECGKGNPSGRTTCMDCGAALSEKTLYDFYRANHRHCPRCGIVVTRTACYCPECGKRLTHAERQAQQEVPV